jgi:hypothetical protein
MNLMTGPNGRKFSLLRQFYFPGDLMLGLLSLTTAAVVNDLSLRLW